MAIDENELEERTLWLIGSCLYNSKDLLSRLDQTIVDALNKTQVDIIRWEITLWLISGALVFVRSELSDKQFSKVRGVVVNTIDKCHQIKPKVIIEYFNIIKNLDLDSHNSSEGLVDEYFLLRVKSLDFIDNKNNRIVSELVSPVTRGSGMFIGMDAFISVPIQEIEVANRQFKKLLV